MIGWCSWGATNLAWAVEYAVQTGRTRIVIFEWPFPLTGLRAIKFGIDCCVFGAFTMFVAFVFVAPKHAGAVVGLREACIVGCVCTSSQPTILSRTKAGHECREGCHRFWLFLAEVAGEPFVADAVFKGR